MFCRFNNLPFFYIHTIAYKHNLNARTRAPRLLCVHKSWRMKGIHIPIML